jgi:hypothetical protein
MPSQGVTLFLLDLLPGGNGKQIQGSVVGGSQILRDGSTLHLDG